MTFLTVLGSRLQESVYFETRGTSSTSAINAVLTDLTPPLGTNLIVGDSENFSFGYNPNGVVLGSKNAIAPNGKTEASTITFPNGGWVINFAEDSLSPDTRCEMVGSVFLKVPNAALSGTFIIYIGRGTSTGGRQAFFTMNSSVVTVNGADTRSYVENHGDGWYRLCMPFTSVRTYSGIGNNITFAKNSLTTTSGDQFLIYGRQFEHGSIASPYTKSSSTFIRSNRLGTSVGFGGISDVSSAPDPKIFFDFTKSEIIPAELTFSRTDSTTCATRINSRGNLELVPANQPRFTYNPVTLKPDGLILEAAVTNIFKNSDMQTTSEWSASNSGTVANATPGSTPFPYFSTCIRLTNTTPTAFLVQVSPYIVLSPSTEYTFSVWCYFPSDVPVNSAKLSAWYDNSGWNEILSSVITERNVWVRKSLKFTTHATYTSTICGVGVNPGTGYVSYFCGAQLETGSTASQYVVSGASATQKAADLLEFSSADKFNRYSVGSVYMEGSARFHSTMPVPLFSPGNNSSEIITIRDANRIGTWNGSLEVNSINMSSNVSNYRTIISYNKAGIIASFNGLSDQTATEGNSNGFLEYASAPKFHYTGRPYDNIIRKFAFYDTKMSISYANFLTANGIPSRSSASGEIQDLVPQGQNLLRNSEFKNLTALPPTNWSWNHTVLNAGITSEMKYYKHQGVDGLSIRIYGTATGVAEYMLIQTQGNPQIAWVTPSSRLTFSAYMALIGGSIGSGKIIEMQLISRGTSGNFLNTSYLTLNSAQINQTLTRYTVPKTTDSDQQSAQIGIKIGINVVLNEVVDMTIFLARPQMNLGETALPYTPTGLNDSSYGKIHSKSESTGEVSDLAPNPNNIRGSFNTLSNVTRKRYPFKDPYGKYNAFTYNPTGVSNSYVGNVVSIWWKRNTTYLKSIFAKRGSGLESRVTFEEFQTFATQTFDLKLLNTSGTNNAAMALFDDGWYLLSTKIGPSSTIPINNTAATFYIDQYGIGALGNDIHLFGPSTTEFVELANINTWGSITPISSGISFNSSTRVITFNGSQTTGSGVSVSPYLGKGKKNYFISFDVTRTSGQVSLKVGNKNHIVSSSGSYNFVCVGDYLEDDSILVYSYQSQFNGTVSNISVGEIERFEENATQYKTLGDSRLSAGIENSFQDLYDDFSAESTLAADIQTAILLISNFASTSSLSQDITTEILLAALAGTGSVSNIISAILETAILLKTDLSSESSFDVDVATEILLSAILSANQTTSGEIQTNIQLQSLGIINSSFDAVDLRQFLLTAIKAMTLLADRRVVSVQQQTEVNELITQLREVEVQARTFRPDIITNSRPNEVETRRFDLVTENTRDVGNKPPQRNY